MSERATSNPEYLDRHPDAVQNIETAHDMALASTEERYRARVWRVSSQLAIEAVRDASSADGESGDYDIRRAYMYIYDKALKNNAKANGLTTHDIDMAHSIVEAHQEKLSSEQGRAEVAERYVRIAERSDEIADSKEESVRRNIESKNYLDS